MLSPFATIHTYYNINKIHRPPYHFGTAHRWDCICLHLIYNHFCTFIPFFLLFLFCGGIWILPLPLCFCWMDLGLLQPIISPLLSFSSPTPTLLCLAHMNVFSLICLTFYFVTGVLPFVVFSIAVLTALVIPLPILLFILHLCVHVLILPLPIIVSSSCFF